MNSKTLRRDICVKVCGREAMMQEKSKEQGNGQKRGYNLLDKDCLLYSFAIRLFLFCLRLRQYPCC